MPNQPSDGGEISPPAPDFADSPPAGVDAMPKRKEILVTWLSIQHAAEPLLTVFANPDSKLYGKVDLVVLCHREPAGDAKSSAAFDRTMKQLSGLPDDIRPEVVLRPWRTSAAPTDHAKLLEFSKRVLRELRESHPEARINIHLSPGTKAMHAIWLILAHGAFVPGPVRLLQTSEERHRTADQEPFEEVKLPNETWAHIVRTSVPVEPGEDSDQILWDVSKVESASGRKTLELVNRWAPLSVPILLVGERGTGKTTLANAIRARSPFRALGKKPWPVVVCGEFQANPQLAQSKLFGHARGAFTDAKGAREGVLEQVAGDTLFLDEVADLDRGTQRLLIAVVEGRDYQRIGDDTPRKANFRLIAATNRPLEQLVASDDGRSADPRGGIDADFFDRISTFVLRIPPLRERRDDLPLLWHSVLGNAARRAAVDGEGLRQLERDRTILAALADHPLPGNVRDLQRAAWRAVAALHGGASTALAAREAIDGLEGIVVTAPASTEAATLEPAEPTLPIDLEAHLRTEERRFIDAALRESGGNKAQAAKLVGMPRKTFDYRLEKVTPK